MKFQIALLASIVSFNLFAVEVGQLAPDFILKGAVGVAHDVKLSAYKGKIVVLEWKNHGCPFVVKHYGSGNMQALQKKYVHKKVVWLSIVSSAPGKQGHQEVEGAKNDYKENKSAATDVLLDPTGEVGQKYEAKTTPHLFIIDKEGKLAYKGAIDDKADTDQASIKDAKNYVAQALDEMLAGKKVSIAKTDSYGCSVKY